MKIEKLLKKYNEMTKDEYIGGTASLEELQNILLKNIHDDDLSLPLFVLYHIIEDIREDQYQRAVTLEECKKIYDVLHGPVTILLNDINNNDDFSKSLDNLVQIFNKYYFNKIK